MILSYWKFQRMYYLFSQGEKQETCGCTYQGDNSIKLQMIQFQFRYVKFIIHLSLKQCFRFPTEVLQFLQLFIQEYQKVLMWSIFGSKQKTKFDLEQTYIRIQFLTKQQREQKSIILHHLANDFDDEDTVINYQDQFKCSFRITLNLPIAFKGKVVLKDLMAHINVTRGQLAEFIETYVQKIIMVMQNDKNLDQDQLIQLYSERDAYLYNPPQIIEIVYQKKSLWTRIKSTSKKVLKNLPAYLLTFLGKFIQYFAGMLGFGSTSQILMKFLPTKIVLQWLLMFITMFFPALAPLIGIGKMII